MNRVTGRFGSVAIALAAVGCSGNDPRPLRPEVLYRNLPEDRRESTDRGGLIMPGGVGASPLPQISSPPEPRRPSTAPTSRPVEPTVRPQAGATPPGTTYMTVGGSVATVAGQPIFADALMRQITPALAARARELPEPRFRQFAMTEIRKQLDQLIVSELFFAAANRELSADDKKIVEAVTSNMREKTITRAGGSLEKARAAAREDGLDFDEQMRQVYRINLVRRYFDRKIDTRVQVTANDLRAAYETRKGKEFTEPGIARWRMIKIAAADVGGVDVARQRVGELRARVVDRGEDFATVAGTINHDPLLLRNNGDVGTIEQGAYRLEEAEKAAWTLTPGSVAQPLQIGSDFYLIKLESKKPRRVASFDEPAVQQKLTKSLEDEQKKRASDAATEQLKRESRDLIVVNDDMLSTALQIAMQNYPVWAQRPEKNP